MTCKREPKNSVKRKRVSQCSLVFLIMSTFCIACSMSILILVWLIKEPSSIIMDRMVVLSVAGLIFVMISTILKWKENCMSADDADEK